MVRRRNNNQPNARNQPRRAPRNNRGRGNANTNAPSSQASHVRGLGAPEAPIHVRGVGRIAQATLAGGAHKDGYVVVDEIISTSIFPRLSRIASAYQRFRFTKLDFNVQPMCPSLAGGGYVAGFLKDPLDKDASFDALQGSYGAVVAKWWEHKTVRVRPPKDLLWTTVGENARLFSPGKFVLTTVGTNTDLVNVSVLCDWEAELSVPSLEDAKDAPATEYILATDILESSLTNGHNEIPQEPFIVGNIADKTVLRSPVPFGIDYKLGPGDVTKANYAYFQVLKAANSAPRLRYGMWNGTEFSGGHPYYYDEQPDQVLLPTGTQLAVVYVHGDPNA